MLEKWGGVPHREMFNIFNMGIGMIAAVAKRYGVTIPQLCIQYTLQLGTVSLPKSSNPEHIRSNVQLDFTISDEDMAALSRIGQDYGEDSWWPVFSKKKQV
jgi:diketogulonate reductase-like aldo/keto reductase